MGTLGWCNGLQARQANLHKWSSSLIGCPIHSALCHIEAKGFVNYYYIITDSYHILIIRIISYLFDIEQVLAATPNKAPTIRPPASHHENYPS